ncbi:MEIOSIS CHROMOSOME SEGREGATION FAMILY PROTEIN [Salix purpurea]|uniref:MEIOSIS CHROMOSOME SEGREGATION FAMILY PROTEIN n=1 Tax=Salix purpurea TaxID=77065 RepID=A0A9Q0ZVH6_SALPP|nr:MEIOSIS CHROMOSOME SEGREGATION FAMILY PROTEIN [Salix purpurea]
MGLPQLSSSSIAEEVATSFSTIVQASPQIVGVSSCDLSGIHGGNLGHRRQIRKGKPLSRIRDGLLSHKSGQNVQTPVPRIIGFESRGLDSPVGVFNRNQTAATVVTISSKAVESSGSDKKRLLSPLSRMLHPDQFNGAALDIGDGICKSNIWASKDNYKVSMSQEHKKAHIGNSSYSNWSASCLPEWKNSPDDTSSPPLSLSPLGPKLSEGKKSPGAGSNITKEFDDDYLTFTDIEQSLNGTVSGILSRKDGGFKMLDESLDNFDNLRTKFDVFTPEIASGIGQPWCEDSNFGPLYVRSCRSFTGVPVRRSLVGSFEESLLSGHLSSGKVSQRIDGFLAVLNITGGNFSPKTQKLPFTVTSMDGNSYLLYYASIGLAREYASKQV